MPKNIQWFLADRITANSFEWTPTMYLPTYLPTYLPMLTKALIWYLTRTDSSTRPDKKIGIKTVFYSLFKCFTILNVQWHFKLGSRETRVLKTKTHSDLCEMGLHKRCKFVLHAFNAFTYATSLRFQFALSLHKMYLLSHIVFI